MRRDLLEPAQAVVSSAGDVELISAKDRELLEALIAAAKRGDFQGAEAVGRSYFSAKNLVIAGASLVASLYVGSTSSYHSGASLVTKTAGEAILTAERSIHKLFDDAPADIRLALQNLIKRLSDEREVPDEPTPTALQGEGAKPGRRK
jgi:hypothetical protein